jgi:hypothetical protein
MNEGKKEGRKEGRKLYVQISILHREDTHIYLKATVLKEQVNLEGQATEEKLSIFECNM